MDIYGWDPKHPSVHVGGMHANPHPHPHPSPDSLDLPFRKLQQEMEVGKT